MKLLLLLLFLPTLSFACLHADQNRIFPIGQSKLGLHVIEVHQRRDDVDLKPVWHVTAFLKIYNEKHQMVDSDSVFTVLDMPEKMYLPNMSDYLKMMVIRSHVKMKVTDVLPKSLYFCDYAADNPEAKLIFDTNNDKVFIQLISGKKHEITVLKESNSIAGDLLASLEGFEEHAKISQLLKGVLCVNSVRKFGLGARKLTVVHLGIGQMLPDANGEIRPPNPYRFKGPFSNIFESMFFEDVLHHGYGFDFMIWE